MTDNEKFYKQKILETMLQVARIEEMSVYFGNGMFDIYILNDLHYSFEELADLVEEQL